MDLSNDAWNDLAELTKEGGLTVDQRLMVAEIKALLSITQELSKFHVDGAGGQ